MVNLRAMQQKYFVKFIDFWGGRYVVKVSGGNKLNFI